MGGAVGHPQATAPSMAFEGGCGQGLCSLQLRVIVAAGFIDSVPCLLGPQAHPQAC